MANKKHKVSGYRTLVQKSSGGNEIIISSQMATGSNNGQTMNLFILRSSFSAEELCVGKLWPGIDSFLAILQS